MMSSIENCRLTSGIESRCALVRLIPTRFPSRFHRSPSVVTCGHGGNSADFSLSAIQPLRSPPFRNWTAEGESVSLGTAICRTQNVAVRLIANDPPGQ